MIIKIYEANMIDYRIKTFLVLCDTMNYRKTAEILNMTQPAVTQHIHFLENEYKCKLFIYDRHTLKVTSEGEMLKNYAENVLFQEQKLLEKMQTAKNPVVRIGATKTIGEFVIDEKLGEYLKNPHNNLLIDIDNTVRLLKRLKRGEIDFALIGDFLTVRSLQAKFIRKKILSAFAVKNTHLQIKPYRLKKHFLKLYLFVRKAREHAQFLNSFCPNTTILRNILNAVYVSVISD